MTSEEKGQANHRLMEFLEAAVRCTIEKNPEKVVFAYLNGDGSVGFSYYGCTYAELQNIGQELINEGMLRLIAASENKIKRLKDEEQDGGGE